MTSLTLRQFCDDLNNHLGRDTGIEQAILDYRQYSNLASVYDGSSDYQNALKGEIGRHLDDRPGAAKIGLARIERVPAKVVRQRRITSAAVKRADPALWEASRVSMMRLGIKTDALAAPRPTGVRFASIQAAWAALEKARQTYANHERRAAAAREIVRATFAEVSDTWDGELVPTADGWALSYSTTAQFNANQCREIATRRGIDLETLKTHISVSFKEQFILVEPDEFDEVDEIDGQ